jgi:hypothetical protein
MSGLLVLSAAPSADLGAATKKYVDDADTIIKTLNWTMRIQKCRITCGSTPDNTGGTSTHPSVAIATSTIPVNAPTAGAVCIPVQWTIGGSMTNAWMRIVDKHLLGTTCMNPASLTTVGGGTPGICCIYAFHSTRSAYDLVSTDYSTAGTRTPYGTLPTYGSGFSFGLAFGTVRDPYADEMVQTSSAGEDDFVYGGYIPFAMAATYEDGLTKRIQFFVKEKSADYGRWTVVEGQAYNGYGSPIPIEYLETSSTDTTQYVYVLDWTAGGKVVLASGSNLCMRVRVFAGGTLKYMTSWVSMKSMLDYSTNTYYEWKSQMLGKTVFHPMLSVTRTGVFPEDDWNFTFYGQLSDWGPDWGLKDTTGSQDRSNWAPTNQVNHVQ